MSGNFFSVSKIHFVFKLDYTLHLLMYESGVIIPLYVGASFFSGLKDLIVSSKLDLADSDGLSALPALLVESTIFPLFALQTLGAFGFAETQMGDRAGALLDAALSALIARAAFSVLPSAANLIASKLSLEW